MTPATLIDANGYVRAYAGHRRWEYEHRRVWEAEHGPIPPGHHVHHVNHNKADNRLENLELLDGREHNRRHTAERHATGQLNNAGPHNRIWRSDLDDRDIVRRRDAGESFRSIARSYGASHHTIRNHYDHATQPTSEGS